MNKKKCSHKHIVLHYSNYCEDCDHVFTEKELLDILSSAPYDTISKTYIANHKTDE